MRGCSRCGMPGHYAKTCGRPPGRAGRAKDERNMLRDARASMLRAVRQMAAGGRPVAAQEIRDLIDRILPERSIW